MAAHAIDDQPAANATLYNNKYALDMISLLIIIKLNSIKSLYSKISYSENLILTTVNAVDKGVIKTCQMGQARTVKMGIRASGWIMEIPTDFMLIISLFIDQIDFWFHQIIYGL